VPRNLLGEKVDAFELPFKLFLAQNTEFFGISLPLSNKYPYPNFGIDFCQMSFD
jgi:hypothetical protein